MKDIIINIVEYLSCRDRTNYAYTYKHNYHSIKGGLVGILNVEKESVKIDQNYCLMNPDGDDCNISIFGM
jgi:hypothetical protein